MASSDLGTVYANPNNLTATITLKIKRVHLYEFRARQAIAVWLIKLAGRVMGMGIEVEIVT